MAFRDQVKFSRVVIKIVGNDYDIDVCMIMTRHLQCNHIYVSFICIVIKCDVSSHVLLFLILSLFTRKKKNEK